MQYEFAARPGKRKRGGDAGASVDSGKKKKLPKKRFNVLTRCSLKELASCILLLKDHHLEVLAESGLGHLKDFKINGNINRRLICFLLNRIDPHTMTLDLRDGNKVLQITAESVKKVFGLPSGNDSPPRPSDDLYVDALKALKDELNIPRN